MASWTLASTASLLSLNLLFFTLVTATQVQWLPSQATCRKDALKLGVCANLLRDLLKIVAGTPPKTPCCPLLANLVDFEAAACLCTALKANVLGLNLDIPLSLSLLLNYCGKEVPSGFQCA